MKIIVVTRTRDEEKNIERFCMAYQWADQILIADGGSLDNTVEIAKSMPKTQVKLFNIRKPMKNGLWRNPQGAHLNFMARWAEREKADWIIYDDCDCFPNFKLKQDARSILKKTRFDFVYAVRLYLWTNDTHFPHMAKPGKGHKNWEASMWAWRASINIQFENTAMAFTWEPKVKDVNKRVNLMPPYCLRHETWVDKERLRRKLEFYHKSGQIPNINHPLDYAGPREKLPDWAREYE